MFLNIYFAFSVTSSNILTRIYISMYVCMYMCVCVCARARTLGGDMRCSVFCYGEYKEIGKPCSRVLYIKFLMDFI